MEEAINLMRKWFVVGMSVLFIIWLIIFATHLYQTIYDDIYNTIVDTEISTS